MPAAAALALALGACSPAPTEPFDAEGVALHALVATIDGTSFLPPLGPQPAALTGRFDPSLVTRLQVVLETEDAAGHLATLGTFTSSTRPGLTLLADHELCGMNVPAATYFTDPSLSYRFRALLDGREVGSFDAFGFSEEPPRLSPVVLPRRFEPRPFVLSARDSRTCRSAAVS